MRKMIPAVILVAFAGCGGSHLPEGAKGGDPPEVVAEYDRIAKLSSCDDVWREWDLRWVHADKHLGESASSRDMGYVGAIAVRGHKLGCSPFDRGTLPPPPCGIMTDHAC